ncbi:MAG TPA: hypothetical protein VFQ05_06545 [Candidatus Eisenbacteria bacterium]|nr:hypothetical protein [Candidatus Eisenbacteria bacterium]
MFAYCVEKFGLSEDSAFKRIRAARAAHRVPALFEAIADGRLNLNGVVLLAPQLTVENAQELLTAASGKTRFQIEQLLAERFPKQDVAPVIRPRRSSEPQSPAPQVLELAAPVSTTEHVVQTGSEPPKAPAVATPANNLPAARPVARTAAPCRVMPLSPGRFKIQLTIGQSALDDLRRAQALLSHQLPSGNLETVIERALRALVERLEKNRFAVTSKPRHTQPQSGNPRTIPSCVRRAVRERDGDQCTFVSTDGHRCSERRFLEFDHVLEIARGGQSTVQGLRLRCRAHNQYMAERTFGVEFMRHKRERTRLARLG